MAAVAERPAPIPLDSYCASTSSSVCAADGPIVICGRCLKTEPPGSIQSEREWPREVGWLRRPSDDAEAEGRRVEEDGVSEGSEFECFDIAICGDASRFCGAGSCCRRAPQATDTGFQPRQV